MRICLDARAPAQGGTRTFVDNFVAQLVHFDSAHEFTCLVNRAVGKPPPNKFGTIVVPYANPPLQIAWIQSRFPSRLKRGRFEVYHSLKHLGPILSPTRDVYHLHAVGQFAGIYPLRPLEGLYWKQLRGLLLKRADLVIAVSDYIKEFLLEHFGLPEERVVRVYNGIDATFRRLKEAEIPAEFFRARGLDRPFILCVGNVVPVKNHSTAVKAFGLLCRSGWRDHLLVIAGGTDHPHFPEVERVVKEWGLQDRVRFVGYLSKPELSYLYNRADALVHPSLHEGFSLTLAEALACGLPVVSPRTTAHPEVVGDAGVYYERPDDWEELAEAIRGLVESSERRSALSERGRRRAAMFSWRRCVSETLTVYDRLQ